MSIGNNLLNTYLTHISNYPAETLEIEVQWILQKIKSKFPEQKHKKL